MGILLRNIVLWGALGLAACGTSPWDMDTILQDVQDTQHLLATQAPLPPVPGPVVFVHPSGRIPVTGGERNMAFLTLALAHQGVPVSVLAPQGPLNDFMEAHGIHADAFDPVAPAEGEQHAVQSALARLHGHLDAWHAAPHNADARLAAVNSWNTLLPLLRVQSYFHPHVRGHRWLEHTVAAPVDATARVAARAAVMRTVAQQQKAYAFVLDQPKDAIAALLAMDGDARRVIWYVQSAIPDTNDAFLANTTQPVACFDTVASIRFGEKSMAVARNGVNVRRFAPHPAMPQARQALGADDSDVVVGHVGYFSPLKDQETLVQALALAVPRNPHLRLALVGDESNQDYVARVQAAAQAGNVAERVRRFAKTDIPPFLNALDVFAFPSRTEGFGLALAEAMASALPCAVSDIAPFHAIGGPALRYFPPGDANALADILVALADDRLARENLGKQARQRVIDESLTLDAMVRQFARHLSKQM